ncbi:hypothetical protein [Microbacterium aureliae]
MNTSIPDTPDSTGYEGVEPESDQPIVPTPDEPLAPTPDEPMAPNPDEPLAPYDESTPPPDYPTE